MFADKTLRKSLQQFLMGIEGVVSQGE